jgi:hypothetical protein
LLNGGTTSRSNIHVSDETVLDEGDEATMFVNTGHTTTSNVNEQPSAHQYRPANQYKQTTAPSYQQKSKESRDNNTGVWVGLALGTFVLILFIVAINNSNEPSENTKIVFNSYFGYGTYKGDLRDGEPDGYGTITYNSGEKFTGQFRNGLAHGHGTLTSATGEILYDGLYENGERKVVEATTHTTPVKISTLQTSVETEAAPTNLEKGDLKADIKFTATKVTVQDGCCQVYGYFTNNGDMAAEIKKSEIFVTIKDENGNLLYSGSQTFDMGGLYVWSGSKYHTYYIYNSSFKTPSGKYYWSINYRNWWNNVQPVHSSKIVSENSSATVTSNLRSGYIKQEGGYTNVRNAPNGDVIMKLQDGSAILYSRYNDSWCVVYNTSGQRLGYVHSSKIVY